MNVCYFCYRFFHTWLNQETHSSDNSREGMNMGISLTPCFMELLDWSKTASRIYWLWNCSGSYGSQTILNHHTPVTVHALRVSCRSWPSLSVSSCPHMQCRAVLIEWSFIHSVIHSSNVYWALTLPGSNSVVDELEKPYWEEGRSQVGGNTVSLMSLFL